MYVTEVSSIATKKLITATDQNSNDNIKSCLVVPAVFTADIHFVTVHYDLLLANH